jgi:hypothetical protein
MNNSEGNASSETGPAGPDSPGAGIEPLVPLPPLEMFTCKDCPSALMAIGCFEMEAFIDAARSRGWEVDTSWGKITVLCPNHAEGRP